MTLTVASPCARHPDQDRLIISSWYQNLNLGCATSPAGKQAFTLSQRHGLTSSAISKTSQRAPTSAQNQGSKELGHLLTSFGLGHGPAAWHWLDPLSCSASPFRFLLLYLSPPPQALPRNPTLSFSIHPHSSSQQPKHLWSNNKAMGMSQKQL